ncbi:hypothetical protein BD289DRAFT_7089 [Coniella lustricola]|uniref:Uncharacterized protein n=1 Tax=Coniella lustricola TaxID=2025994 RepID=A0A2T3AJM6_9PEZI|nr:hypothetical protein BD289DRAFT_7089 [Coniella lustricola]
MYVASVHKTSQRSTYMYLRQDDTGLMWSRGLSLSCRTSFTTWGFEEVLGQPGPIRNTHLSSTSVERKDRKRRHVPSEDSIRPTVLLARVLLQSVRVRQSSRIYPIGILEAVNFTVEREMECSAISLLILLNLLPQSNQIRHAQKAGNTTASPWYLLTIHT